MANLDGPPYYDSSLGDVAVPAAVAPLGTPPFGSFPSMRTSCIVGSPKLVATIVDRNAIPTALRAEGMTCFVQATQLTYQLLLGVTNADWVAVSATSSSVQETLPYAGLVVALDAVYVSGGATAQRANATSAATSKVIGIVSAIDVPAIGQATVVTSGRVTGFVGLTPGTQYVLSTSPGVFVAETDTLNSFYPSAVGNVLIPVAIALSATDLHVNVSGYALQF